MTWYQLVLSGFEDSFPEMVSVTDRYCIFTLTYLRRIDKCGVSLFALSLL